MPQFTFPLITEPSLGLLITQPPFIPADIFSFDSGRLFLVVSEWSCGLKLSLCCLMRTLSLVLPVIWVTIREALRVYYSLEPLPLHDCRDICPSHISEGCWSRVSLEHLLMARGIFYGTDIKWLAKVSGLMSAKNRTQVLDYPSSCFCFPLKLLSNAPDNGQTQDKLLSFYWEWLWLLLQDFCADES